MLQFVDHGPRVLSPVVAGVRLNSGCLGPGPQEGVSRESHVKYLRDSVKPYGLRFALLGDWAAFFGGWQNGWCLVLKPRHESVPTHEFEL